VTKKSKGGPEALSQIVMNDRHFGYSAPAEFGSDRCQTRIVKITRQTQRHDCHASDSRMQLCEVVNCLTQNFAVIDIGAQHYLRMNLNFGVKQLPHLLTNISSLLIDSQEISPDF